MFGYLRRRMRELVHKRRYVVSTHADETMHDDCLSIYDLEHLILVGEIVERQRDTVTGEWKYRIIGQTLGNGNAQEVVKMGRTGKLVIITVFKG